MRNTGLYRSTEHHVVAGVLGGIGEHFDWNINILRLIFVLITIFSVAFPGILIYLILWMVMPKRPQITPPALPDTQ